MKKEEWIKQVRHYLNEPLMEYLYIKSLETENINELMKLLRSAKSLMGTYVDDANFYLRIAIEENINDNHETK